VDTSDEGVGPVEALFNKAKLKIKTRIDDDDVVKAVGRAFRGDTSNKLLIECIDRVSEALPHGPTTLTDDSGTQADFRIPSPTDTSIVVPSTPELLEEASFEVPESPTLSREPSEVQTFEALLEDQAAPVLEKLLEAVKLGRPESPEPSSFDEPETPTTQREPSSPPASSAHVTRTPEEHETENTPEQQTAPQTYTHDELQTFKALAEPALTDLLEAINPELSGRRSTETPNPPNRSGPEE
jgi:hypothetical protein